MLIKQFYFVFATIATIVTILSQGLESIFETVTAAQVSDLGL